MVPMYKLQRDTYIGRQYGKVNPFWPCCSNSPTWVPALEYWGVTTQSSFMVKEKEFPSLSGIFHLQEETQAREMKGRWDPQSILLARHL